MKTKRIAAFLIMLCMVLNMLPPLHTYAEDAATSGTCGDNLTWTLVDGVLTISGTGAMYNYDNEVNPTPWYAQRETITEIEVAEGVESLGDFAFADSVNLQAVSLPESLTQIGGWAFLGCTALQTIQIPDGVCEVGTQAFAWMYNLTDVYIGENLSTLGTETFQDCSAISITVAENNPTYSSDAGALYNKDKTVLLKAPGTRGDVFVVPATVTEIGGSAFSKTLTAKKVILPEGLTTIWDYAFYGVLTLHEINVPSSVNYIGDFAFGASHQALTITFEGERPDSIHAEIFSDSVVTAYYPSDSTTWTESNRLSCGGTTTWICLDVSGTCGENLTWTLLNGVLTISGTGAMAEYDASTNPAPWLDEQYKLTITKVVIEEGVTTIAKDAFHGCTNLVSATIPDSVVSIGGFAFYYCASLQQICVSANVTEIGENAFAFTTSLERIEVDENNIAYCSDSNGVLFDKDKLCLIQAPGKITGSYVIPASVTSIRDFAFMTCTQLSAVSIPSGVASIGALAFYNCSGLTNVIYCGTEEQWNAISVGALNTALTDAARQYHDWQEATCTAPKTCTVCGETEGENLGHDWADGSCTVCGAASGTCGDNLTWTLDNGVLTISGTGAMDNYDNEVAPTPWADYRASITTVEVCEGVESIGSFAFESCQNLQTVILPEGLTQIGGWAFLGCDALTSIQFPTSVTKLGTQCLAWCDTLQDVHIGENLTTIGTSAFEMCRVIRFTVSENNPNYSADAAGALYDKEKTVLLKAPGTGGDIFEVAETVTWISDGSFSETYTARQVILPEGLTVIDAYAFYRTQNLQQINVPATVTEIWDFAFGHVAEELTITFEGEVPEDYVCTNMFIGSVVNAYYPGNSTTWNESTLKAYGGTTTWNRMSIGGICGDNLTWTLAGGVLTISGTGAMYDYGTDLLGDYSYEDFAAPWYAERENIYRVVIEPGVTVIGEDAFYGCSAVTAVEIPDTVTEIRPDVFNGCSNLTEITIPAGVTSISKAVFKGCTSLTTVTVPAGITTIGQYAFAGSGIQQITLPETLTSIDSFAFINCTELKIIDIPDSVSQLGFEVFSGCTGLQTAYLPQALTRIEMGMFYGCSALECVEFPGNLTRITDQAFVNCKNLQSIRLPGSVTSIGYGAFDLCKNLTQVTYCGTEEQWNAISISSYNTYLEEATRQYHDWQEATCETAKTCAICGAAEGEALGHTWAEATCEAPKTCAVCGETEGEALGHSWVDATCETAKTCTVCGETEGEALGHTFEDHICFCGMIDDEQALIAAIELSGDGKVTVFDAQILAEAKAGLRTLTDEQWALLGGLSPDKILNYVLGQYQTAE